MADSADHIDLCTWHIVIRSRILSFPPLIYTLGYMYSTCIFQFRLVLLPYYYHGGSPVSVRVPIERREQGDASEDGTTSTEPKEEQRLVRVKVNHTNLIMKELHVIHV